MSLCYIQKYLKFSLFTVAGGPMFFAPPSIIVCICVYIHTYIHTCIYWSTSSTLNLLVEHPNGSSVCKKVYLSNLQMFFVGERGRRQSLSCFLHVYLLFTMFLDPLSLCSPQNSVVGEGFMFLRCPVYLFVRLSVRLVRY